MKIKKKQRFILLWSATILGALALGAWRTGSMSAVYISLLAPRPTPVPSPTLQTTVVPLKPAAVKRSVQNVRIRIFADAHMHQLTIAAAHGLQLLPKRKIILGAVTLLAGKERVLIQQGGKTLMTAGQMKLAAAAEDGLLTLRLTHGRSRDVDGELIVTVRKGELVLVNDTDLESYVMGTIEPELGSLNLPVEALKAQLVASRSYILALQNHHPGQTYDFCDTAHCQMFTGVGHYPQRFKEAAAQTQGLYLTYKGKPAAAFYHHSCGGQTAAISDIWPGPAIPYLRRVQDGPTDASYCSIGSRQEWRFTIDRQSLRRCFAKQGWIHGSEALDTLRVMRVNASGRAGQILIQSSQPRWISADAFRHAVNQYFKQEVLLSTWFTIERVGQGYEFRGRGWGHGVGMCQVGAIYLARHHHTYRQILTHYFPGTQISHLPAAQKIPRRRDSRLREYFRYWLD